MAPIAMAQVQSTTLVQYILVSSLTTHTPLCRQVFLSMCTIENLLRFRSTTPLRFQYILVALSRDRLAHIVVTSHPRLAKPPKWIELYKRNRWWQQCYPYTRWSVGDMGWAVCDFGPWVLTTLSTNLKILSKLESFYLLEVSQTSWLSVRSELFKPICIVEQSMVEMDFCPPVTQSLTHFWTDFLS